MIYALAEMWHDATKVLEYEDEDGALWAFKRLCAGRWGRGRVLSVTYMWLFRTHDDALRAIVDNPDEIEVNEATAYKVLEWESAYGVHGFSSRAPQPIS